MSKDTLFLGSKPTPSRWSLFCVVHALVSNYMLLFPTSIDHTEGEGWQNRHVSIIARPITFFPTQFIYYYFNYRLQVTLSLVSLQFAWHSNIIADDFMVIIVNNFLSCDKTTRVKKYFPLYQWYQTNVPFVSILFRTGIV